MRCWKVALPVVALVSLGACVRSASEPCGDQVCAAGLVCVRATEAVTHCVAPDQFADCRDAGRSDGDLCDQGNGRCYDGACLPIECGDRLVDPLEQCDDGDNRPGDGCSADCSSNEVCGNGVVDPIKREICDDGNLLGHDGCNDACEPETPRWRVLIPAMPVTTSPWTLAYMETTGRVLSLPADAASSVLYAWNGFGWLQAPSSSGPAARQEQAMVYDAARERVVLFGGNPGPLSGGGFNDTWEWDGDEWSLVAVEAEDRSSPAAAYDPKRKKVIAFGGYQQRGVTTFVRSDTVAWDGSAWTTIATAGPTARWGAAMAYDPIGGQIVLFGGRTSGINVLADTWVLRDATWTKVDATGPVARSGAVLIPGPGGLVLYGGTNGAALADGWRWTGTGWTSLGPQAPGARAAPAAAFDTARRRAVLFGSGPNNDPRTWEWDGTAWRGVTPEVPMAVEYAASTYDPLHQQALVLAGGITWAVRDGSWTTLTTASATALSGPGLVYDLLRDRAVLFGGVNSASVPSGATRYLATGTQPPAWTLASVTTSPPARWSHAMAYQPGTGTTLVFGGSDTLTPLADTWELDSDWHQRMPATSPPARSAAVMAVDPIRNQTILFGGVDAMNKPLGDTWQWTGSNWVELHPMGPMPTARSGATLTWNPSRRRLALFGGTAPIGQLADTWEWTGEQWTQIRSLAPPPPRAAHVTTPDSHGTGLVTFSGGGVTGPIADQWLLTWSTDDRAYERCLPHQDGDRDLRVTCDDPECWWSCSPLCGPGLSCATTAPRCGDGMPDPLESCQLCPADRGACPLCGDRACEATETAASCPGDCP